MTSTIGKRFAFVALSLAMISGLCVLNVSTSSAMAETPAVTGPSDSWTVALKNLKNAATRVKKATVDVINDVGQRKVAAEIGDPRFLQPSDRQIEKNPKLWAQELAQQGPLEAPRKAWLDTDMANLKRWIDVLSADIAVTPSASNPDAQALWTEMSAVIKDLNQHFTTLEGLTSGPTYNNLAIASAAFSVRDDINRLEKPWKAAVRVSGKSK